MTGIRYITLRLKKQYKKEGAGYLLLLFLTRGLRVQTIACSSEILNE